MALRNFLRRHHSSSSSASSAYSYHSINTPNSHYSEKQEAFPIYQHDHREFEKSSPDMAPTIVAAVQESSKMEKVNGRETGFPEPLSPGTYPLSLFSLDPLLYATRSRERGSIWQRRNANVGQQIATPPSLTPQPTPLPTPP